MSSFFPDGKEVEKRKLAGNTLEIIFYPFKSQIIKSLPFVILFSFFSDFCYKIEWNEINSKKFLGLDCLGSNGNSAIY